METTSKDAKDAIIGAKDATPEKVEKPKNDIATELAINKEHILSVKDKLSLIEARQVAKEVASKYIGRTAVPWIAFLVVVGVISSYFLPSSSLPAVIGLVSTAVMAFISMLTGITGTKEKEERPEIEIIKELIHRLDQREPPVEVRVEDDQVVVTHGGDMLKTSRNKPNDEPKD